MRYVVTAAAGAAEAEEKQSPLSRLFGGAGNCVPASVSSFGRSGTQVITWTLSLPLSGASDRHEAVEAIAPALEIQFFMRHSVFHMQLRFWLSA